MSTPKNNNHPPTSEDFIKQNPLIFKKYRPLKLLGKGTFSNVYLGYSIINKQYVAIKTELRNDSQQYLESEAYILFILKGFGVPELFSYGHIKNYNVLIQTLLGKSLLNLYNERNNRFTLKDVCIIGMQILDRIEWVHSKDYIHRDIKPENFLIGNSDPNIIYLIDFGLCKKYRSSKSGKHTLPLPTGRVNGTIKYLSVNALKGKETGRRDDIISIGYMLIIFLLGDLPWGNTINKITRQKYNEMIYKREKITPEQLCFGLPKQFEDYIKYAYNLTFDEKPDYDYLRNLLAKVLELKNFKDNKYIFSWVNKNQLNSIIKIKPKRSNSRGSRSNSRHRLLEKIETSLKNNNKITLSSSNNENNLINYYNEYSPLNKINNIKMKNYISPRQVRIKKKLQLINISNTKRSLSPLNNYNLLKNANMKISEALKKKLHNSIISSCDKSNLNNSKNSANNNRDFNATLNNDFNMSAKGTINNNTARKQNKIFLSLISNDSSKNTLNEREIINSNNNFNSIIEHSNSAKIYDNLNNFNLKNSINYNILTLNNSRMMSDQGKSPKNKLIAITENDEQKLKNKKINLLNNNMRNCSQTVIVIDKKSHILPYKKKLIVNKRKSFKDNISFITLNTTNNTSNNNITNYNLISNIKNSLKFSLNNPYANDYSYACSDVVNLKRKDHSQTNNNNMNIKLNSNNILLNPKLSYIQISKNKFIPKIKIGEEINKPRNCIRFINEK